MNDESQLDGDSIAALPVQAKPDTTQLKQFVTTIKNAEQQVGEHVIASLQQPNTVAILTTVVMGADGQQRIVSVGLNDERLAEVQKLLQQAAEQREPEEPCVGFHCMVKPKSAQP